MVNFGTYLQDMPRRLAITIRGAVDDESRARVRQTSPEVH